MVLWVLLAEYVGIAVMAFLGYVYHGVVPRSLIDMLRSQINQTVVGPLSIFAHNAVLMTADSVPFIGPAALAFSISATGFILGVVIGYAAGGFGFLALVAGYLASVALPHGILELSAYAFATAGSIDASRRLLSRRGGVLKSWLIHYAIALALLLAAAYLEWLELTWLGGILPKFG